MTAATLSRRERGNRPGYATCAGSAPTTSPDRCSFGRSAAVEHVAGSPRAAPSPARSRSRRAAGSPRRSGRASSRRRSRPHTQPRRRRARRLAASQRRLVERPRRQVEAHAERDEHEPAARVVEARAERDVHQLRPDRRQRQRDERREGGDQHHGHADRRVENPSAPSRASRPVRWGSSDVWIAWKSCSGARAISSALKTIAAQLGCRGTRQHADRDQRLLGELDRRDRDREPGRLAHRAGDRRPPSRRRCGRGGAAPTARRAATRTAPRGCRARPRVCPDAMPTATATGNMNRATDSNSTSPPYSANHWWPAR